MTRRRAGSYYLIEEEISVKLFEHYKSFWGTLLEGVLKAGLGAITASMSEESVGEDKMAGGNMLALHAGLGAIWLFLVGKDFAEAGFDRKAINENVEDLTVEILTYAKLKSRGNFEEVSPQDFINQVNQEIIAIINNVLKDRDLSEISSNSEDFQGSQDQQMQKFREEIMGKLKDSTSVLHKDVLLNLAKIGLAATISGAVAIPFSASSLAAPIAVASIGASLTSISAALLKAGAQNPKEISASLSKGVRIKNDELFSDQDVDSVRQDVRSSLVLEEERIRRQNARPQGILSQVFAGGRVAPSNTEMTEL